MLAVKGEGLIASLLGSKPWKLLGDHSRFLIENEI
jgi:hypothetical protein